MPETDFVLTDADRHRLLRWTVEQGAVLVPDLHYHEPHYEEIRSLDRLEPFLDQRHLFVLRSDWQVEKLLMTPCVNKFKGPGFYIAQRYGGPSLTYLLYPQREAGGTSILGKGSIHHYPSYYSSTGSGLDVPQALRKFYSAAIRAMKKGGSRVKAKVRAAWVSKDAAQLLTSGQAIAPEPWSEASRSFATSAGRD